MFANAIETPIFAKVIRTAKRRTKGRIFKTKKNIKMEKRNFFEHLGYLKEYYVDGLYIGMVNYEESDREIVGYMGRQTEVLSTSVILDNKRKINAGTKVMTIVYPLCGKMIKK